ncbi:hypothetical protein CY35_03G061800 [Sphagnum magellanicum]|nr:hypothetical protein CY35_03G061800 [Sphagnum magellanicum]
MWKLDGQDVKPHGSCSGRKVVIDNELIRRIESLRCNCDGSKLSFLVGSLANDCLVSSLYVYDTQLDRFLVFDLRTINSRPVSHCWDGEESKLLACEIIPEEVDQKTRASLLDFIYNTLVGNITEAYKAVCGIKDKGIWENIAGTCMKTKHVDVALHCFANMESASAAAFVTRANNELEENVRVAAVAIQLGKIDDAYKLYASCQRYDLLNLLYQTCGEWEKAVEVATQYDRVNLRNTHHAYAKYLEGVGKIKEAIHHYELSGTHRYEVPRMLYSVQQVEDLQDYIDNSSDPALQRWWARFCEANKLLPEAIEYYTAAGDILSLVRVYCHQKDFDTAAKVVSSTSDLAAAFHLGGEYEKIGEIAQAIHFFMKAGKSTYAAQMAMKYGVDKELLSLSLQGGDLERAIDICFCSQLFDALKAIAEDLDEAADPALLARCGDFLMQHKQIEKAVQLFIAAKQHRHAIDLCMKEGIIITDKMAEAIAPKSEDKKTEEWTQLLSYLAECCHNQGSYHLACKKYTQSGDRIAAMKSLLKSGDTERIIFFANVSRQKNIFVLAANYLQTLDWHGDAKIMKIIVQMYTKAAEMESLASFYEACAQIEIDEFRDYEKALEAMKEALKYLEKSRGIDKEKKVQSMQFQIQEVEQFVQLQGMAKTDPTGFVHACRELLQNSCGNVNSQAALRVGDLYALLIEFYFNQGSMEQAYQVIERMQSCKLLISPYVDKNMVESIYQVCPKS